MSVPTIAQWLGVLEMTAQILIVPPFYENLGKRLIKSPKIYVADAGLACHLLGIDTAGELARSPFRGALFEGFIAAEIAKAQVNAGGRRELYYFRDEQGLEVDFLVPGRAGAVALVECIAGRTVTPAMAAPMQRLAEALKRKRAKGCRDEDVPRPSVTTGGDTDTGCRSRRRGRCRGRNFSKSCDGEANLSQASKGHNADNHTQAKPHYP